MRRTIIVLAAVASMASVAPTGHAAEGKLSIEAWYDAHPTPDPLCGGFRVVGDGVATGSPIGWAAWHDEECADVVAQPGVFSVREGRLTLTTVAGDVLVARYEAVGTPPDSEGNIYLSGSFTIVGGAGRFQDASGGGTVTAVANAFDPATTAHMEGSFSLRRAG